MTHHPGGPRAAGRRRPAAPIVALAAAALALVGLLLPAAPGSAASGPTAGADAAIAWLDAEVAANGGTMPGFSPGSTDWGLTADVALARAATGRAGEPATVALVTALVGAVDDYSTWDGLGASFAGVRVSGALAKVVLVGHLAGVEVSPAGGVDLEAELRGLMQATGSQTGRFSDRNPYATDKSNGFDQAYALLALRAGPGEVPAAGLQYLLAQQCPGGGFRLVYADDGGCGSDGQADPDATALAVQVLLAVPRTAGVEVALARALGWLLAVQQPDGAVVGSPPTERPNANSTGLVGQALRAAGQPEAAELSAAWVAGELQLGTSAVGTPAEADTGAIAYEPARRADALASGIAPQGRDQWRHASAQGVLALGAEPFLGPPSGMPVAPAPSPGGSTTTSTAPAPSADPDTVPPGGTPTGSGGAGTPVPDPAVPGAPTTAPIATPAADGTPGSTADTAGSPAAGTPATGVAGSSGTSSTGANGATGNGATGNGAAGLAFSGWTQAWLAWPGLALVLAGLGLVAAGLRSRRSRRPAWHWG